MTFRALRIAVLLFILLCVALGTWLSRARTTDWDRPLWVAVYPINADGSDASERHIARLSEQSFDAVERFLAEEAKLFEAPLAEPVQMKLYAQVRDLPPARKVGGNMLSHVIYSLRLRFWAWRTESNHEGPPPDVGIYVLYYDPARSPSLPHSLGLQKGLIGVVHAFADGRMHGENCIVIAHELLHTLGATDKYDPGDGKPFFPDGFAEPERDPLYPQPFAEIMAGRRMVNESLWEMPASLDEVTIGATTASEINW
jgi:hypothetical protein